MNYIRPLAFTAAVCATLGLSSLAGATAATMMVPAVSTTANTVTALGGKPGIIKVQKTPGKRKTGPYSNKRNNNKNRKRHRKNKRRYYNPGVYLDGGIYGYDSYYDDPYYDDPYYDPYYSAPKYKRGRYSCGQIRNMLRQHGYRHIRAHDCTGKVYTFIAYAGHKRYKLRVRSKNGSIKTRKRI